MKVISTNTGSPRKVSFNGQTVETGTFKFPVDHPILLETHDVRGDSVVDRSVHGGPEKACYLYSADHYPYWKNLYPKLHWNWGMFGENISVEGLDETAIHVGSIYSLGEAVVQAIQPRQPCYKLGIRFNDPGILKKFVSTLYSGVYLKILEPGEVKTGDDLELKARGSGLSIADVFVLLFSREVKQSMVEAALANEVLPENCKAAIRKRVGASG